MYCPNLQPDRIEENMTSENDKTVMEPLPASPSGGEDLLDLAATFGPTVVDLTDTGMTIKQAVPAEEAKTVCEPASETESPTVQEGAFRDDATVVGPAGTVGDAGAEDSATVLVSRQPHGADSADPEALQETRIEGTQPQSVPTTANGKSASQSGTLGASGQSVVGRSQSVNLLTGGSSVSINIHPRTIVKTASGAQINYDGKPASADIATDFELLEQLGEGGMGVVYAARQSSIDRPIALKMIKGAALNDAGARAKFLQEAVVTGDLDHPNIVTVHDLGADANGNVFYAMKKISGTEWRKALRQKNQRENIDVFLSVCDAVAFAHSRGVIHRDLKPENVMLGSFGEVLVMDWGLAVAVNERGKAERIGAGTGICGTPAYLAPEMTTPGRWREIGFCSDIYLLGAILFEILTGHRPHTGKTVGECLRNAAQNQIRETNVTGELMDIARKAMAARPADRFATVQELQAAIRGYLAHSESVLLEQKAHEDLQLAQQTRQHEDFAKALFGFRQACEMWDGNRQAMAGLVETVRLYATAAMQSGDLDLALSLVKRDRFAECEPLAAAIVAAIGKRDQQRQRNRRLRLGVMALTAAVLIISVVAAVLINAEKVKAEKALQAEVAARRAEQEAREQEARERQQKQAAQAEAKESKEVIRQRDELAENKWWAFSPEDAQARREKANTGALPPIRTIALGKGAELSLALVPAGTFAMGSALGENGRLSEEHLHRVAISKPFYLAQYELTIGQYKALGGKVEAQANGAAGTNDPNALPVAGLSWDDVTQQVLPALNKYAPSGWRFALPTEAQWEWACRAGSTTAFYTGDDEAALRKAGFSGSENLTGVSAVGKRAPNAWGLYDMHGNLAEWCQDYYSKEFYPTGAEVSADPVAGENKLNKRVVRGGSWSNLDIHCRSAYRSYATPSSRYQFIGVRLALVGQQ